MQGFTTPHCQASPVWGCPRGQTDVQTQLSLTLSPSGGSVELSTHPPPLPTLLSYSWRPLGYVPRAQGQALLLGGLTLHSPLKGVSHQHVCLLYEYWSYNAPPVVPLGTAPSPRVTLSHRRARVEGGMEQRGTNDLPTSWLHFVTCFCWFCPKAKLLVSLVAQRLTS